MKPSTGKFEVFGSIDNAMARAFCAWLEDSRECSWLDIAIDSDGGSAAALTNMLCGLQSHGAIRVTTRAVGFAASAAAVLFAMGHRRIVTCDGAVMIHNAHLAGDCDGGNAREYSETIASILSNRLSLDRGQILNWLDREVAFNAADALQWGVATEVDGIRRTRRKVDLSRFARPTRDSAGLCATRKQVDAAEFLARRAERLTRLSHQSPERLSVATRQRPAMGLASLPHGIYATRQNLVANGMSSASVYGSQEAASAINRAVSGQQSEETDRKASLRTLENLLRSSQKIEAKISFKKAALST